ncbi:hypothetical protein BKA81DRAFT_26121 [Phyllosticta paracitricarpa]
MYFKCHIKRHLSPSLEASSHYKKEAPHARMFSTSLCLSHTREILYLLYHSTHLFASNPVLLLSKRPLTVGGPLHLLHARVHTHPSFPTKPPPHTFPPLHSAPATNLASHPNAPYRSAPDSTIEFHKPCIWLAGFDGGRVHVDQTTRQLRHGTTAEAETEDVSSAYPRSPAGMEYGRGGMYVELWM